MDSQKLSLIDNTLNSVMEDESVAGTDAVADQAAWDRDDVSQM